MSLEVAMPGNCPAGRISLHVAVISVALFTITNAIAAEPLCQWANPEVRAQNQAIYRKLAGLESCFAPDAPNAAAANRTSCNWFVAKYLEASGVPNRFLSYPVDDVIQGRRGQ